MDSNAEQMDLFDSDLSVFREELERGFSTEQSISSITDAKPRRRRRIHKNQKDSFDYQAHISKELEKHQHKNRTEEQKKVVIVRIRNRMSAQRSRTRQRERFGVLLEYSKRLQLQAK